MHSVIQFDQVSKRYFRGSGGPSLRSALSGVFAPLLGQGRPVRSELWALRDVSFDVQPGESIGLLGHNGAGKTTVLKLLAGITVPTLGAIRVNGRLGSLIELGAGFHPEMTGRENVYLNGVIMGMTRAEVGRRFDEIVDFSGIGEFIDTPVKRYSSGMYMRLAFAIAAHIEPTVLLVDEVLAVGDVGFRAKCYRRMAELRRNGTTVVLVSHDVNAVRDVCDRALLLWRGELLDDGDPERVIATHLGRMSESGDSSQEVDPDQPAQLPVSDNNRVSDQATIIAVQLIDDLGRQTDSIVSGGGLTVQVDFVVHKEIETPIFRIDFYRRGELYTGYSTAYDGLPLAARNGQGRMCLRIDGFTAPAGVYSVSVVISDRYEYNLLDVHHQRYPLYVVQAPDTRGVVTLAHEWHD